MTDEIKPAAYQYEVMGEFKLSYNEIDEFGSPEPLYTEEQVQAMVAAAYGDISRQFHRYIGEDVLPSYDVPSDVWFNDPEAYDAHQSIRQYSPDNAKAALSKMLAEAWDKGWEVGAGAAGFNDTVAGNPYTEGENDD